MFFSSLHLQLRLASQQLSTSHCNYCACSLDIFHKSSQIAKFFLREEKKAKEREAVETQLVTHYQQSFEYSNCLLWSMVHLKHFGIKAFAVSAQDCAYSLLDAWDTKNMLRIEKNLLFSVNIILILKYFVVRIRMFSESSHPYRKEAVLVLCSSMIQAGSQHSWKPCCTLVSTAITVLLFFTCVDKCTVSVSSVSAGIGPFSIDMVIVQTQCPWWNARGRCTSMW